jgi:drug/metabolite transporter (DMT)-like permease
MKRIIWMFALALVGFALGWNGQGSHFDPRDVTVATLWGACIGFGIGTIFGENRRRSTLLAAWTVTLMLVGCLLSPLVPFADIRVQFAIAGAIGGFLGLSIGLFQMRHHHSRSVPQH